MPKGNRRTLTSAWIETARVRAFFPSLARRTLTSAWIETMFKLPTKEEMEVALSRVRGLKPRNQHLVIADTQSHSHECVD